MNGARQLHEVLDDVGHAPDEVDGRRSLLHHPNGDLAHAHASAVRADDELAREDVLVDDARPHDQKHHVATKRFEAVRVRPLEAEERAEDAVVEEARRMPRHRSVVGRSREQLRSDHHVDFGSIEDLDGAKVEVDVAEIDLLADDVRAARILDARAKGRAIVRLGDGERPHLGILPREPLGDVTRRVARAVLCEDDLVREIERRELLSEIDDRRVEDGLFVVDGDDVRDVGSPGTELEFAL